MHTLLDTPPDPESGKPNWRKKIKTNNKNVTLERLDTLFTIMVLNARPGHHCLNPIRYTCVVDPDSLSLDPYPAFQVNLGPDPGF